MKRKLALFLAVCVSLNIFSACKPKIAPQNEGSFFKGITKVRSYEKNLPEDFQFMDYQARAELYDELVFSASGESGLSLSWQDETNGVLAVPAYVGDHRFGRDGTQEAVTFLPAILSGTYAGIDKSSQEGIDYVSMADIFFHEEESIVVNNPGAGSADASMWYLLYPSILYTQVAVEYENEILLDHTMKMIGQWYGAFEIMNSPEYSGFDYTGFDFVKNEPYRNGIWTEPDCAVGIAVLMDYGYELTGEEKYKEAAMVLMDHIEGYFGSPLYEALMYFGPFLAAKFNALYGTDYDMDKALDRTFGDGSVPRGGWGSVSGRWGEFPVDGLFGSATDGGGYAFSMNTFAAAKAIAPMVRYDPRYAAQIGKWLLHAYQNSRYFFAGESDPAFQSYQGSPALDERIPKAVPYEGIRREKHGTSPWIGGDPLEYGWALTDFSLYSGAHTGMFASLFEETDVEGIFRICLSTPLDKELCYLLYNPYAEEKRVTLSLSGEDMDLYDAVSNQVLENSPELDGVTIPGSSAVVLTEIPKGGTLTEEGNGYFCNGKFLAAKKLGISIVGLENNQVIDGKASFYIEGQINSGEPVRLSTTVTLDGQVLTSDKKGRFIIDGKKSGQGRKKLTVQAVDESGLRDEVTIRVILE